MTNPDTGADELRNLLQSLEKHVTIVASATKKLKRVDARDSGQVARILGQILQGLGELKGLGEVLQTTELQEATRAEQKFLELEADIRAACRDRGWSIEGAWPKLYIERGVAV